MTRIYFQKDAAADDGTTAACSPAGPASTTMDRAMDESGPVGSGTADIASNSDSPPDRAIHIESAAGQPGETTWPAGFVVVRLNITTANSNVRWSQIDICQVDSTGSNKATWGGLFTGNISLDAGVFTFFVPVTEITGALTSDQIYIVVEIVRTAGHGPQTATMTMDQLIDTPFDTTPIVDRYEHMAQPNPSIRM